MQVKILQEYEKVKDKLSEEEFLAEIEKVKANNEDLEFIDDFGAAQIVVQNLGVEASIEDNRVEEESFAMTEELQERYDKVKDQISEEEFFKRMEFYRKREEGNTFVNSDVQFADLVVFEYISEEPEKISERPEYNIDTIANLEKGGRGVTISGRVISISNPRSFKTR